MTIYNGSPEHLANAAAARFKATSISSSCPHCDKPLSKASAAKHLPTCPKNPNNLAHCVECGQELTKRRAKFCSKSCAAKYNNRFREEMHKDIKKKISAALKARYETVGRTQGKQTVPSKKATEIQIKECASCENLFVIRGWKNPKKCCSEACVDECKMKRANPFRCLSIPYDHNGKTIYLQSRWEVAVAEHLNLQRHLMDTSSISSVDRRSRQDAALPSGFPSNRAQRLSRPEEPMGSDGGQA